MDFAAIDTDPEIASIFQFPPQHHQNISIPTIKEYYKSKINFNKYTIPQLKQIARHYKLHISGTKPILEKRVENFYMTTAAIIHIQSVYRGWLARQYIHHIHGPAFLRRGACVNDTDFVTLDRMDEIAPEYFMSFKDEQNLVYGFDITSLISHISKSVSCSDGRQPLINPYTRKPFPAGFMEKVFRYIRIYRIFRPDVSIIDTSIYHLVYRFGADIQRYLYQVNTLRRVQQIHEKPLDERIRDIFIEIDMLGNYTSAKWFSNLNVPELLMYWNTLYDIWLFRADILDETKKKICPIHEPFYRKMLTLPSYTKNEILDTCLYAMENMIYMSDDDEYRKLGVTYVLMALTCVSFPARLALPWLFEILAY
jgi:hypothetical protein